MKGEEIFNKILKNKNDLETVQEIATEVLKYWTNFDNGRQLYMNNAALSFNFETGLYDKSLLSNTYAPEKMQSHEKKAQDLVKQKFMVILFLADEDEKDDFENYLKARLNNNPISFIQECKKGIVTAYISPEEELQNKIASLEKEFENLLKEKTKKKEDKHTLPKDIKLDELINAIASEKKFSPAAQNSQALLIEYLKEAKSKNIGLSYEEYQKRTEEMAKIKKVDIYFSNWINNRQVLENIEYAFGGSLKSYLEIQEREMKKLEEKQAEIFSLKEKKKSLK